MVPSTASTSSSSSKKERRAYPRLGFRCPVTWDHGQDSSVTRAGYSRDISEAGAGFVTRKISSPRVGDFIRVVFDLDDRHEWLIDDKARVVRCDPVGENLCNVGVELTTTILQ